MSSIRTNSVRRGGYDHFEPENNLDPAAQRRLRGRLEKIDYTAYASNGAVLSQALGTIDDARIQRMAVACSTARADWLKAALALSETPGAPAREAVDALAARRALFEELTEAYEGMRRLVERGYIPA